MKTDKRLLEIDKKIEEINKKIGEDATFALPLEIGSIPEKSKPTITVEQARQNTINIIPDSMKEHIAKLIEEASNKGLFSTSMGVTWYCDKIKKANPDTFLLEDICIGNSLREYLTGLGFEAIVRQIGDGLEFSIEIYWDYRKRE